MTKKEFLTMADAFPDGAPGLPAYWSDEEVKHAAHAINAHDELVCQRDQLLDAMRQTLAMLRVTSHGPSAANKAEEMLHAAICSLGTSHSPDAGKMVHDGWQLVPVEPTPEMLVAIGGAKPRYKAMLAAAPKLGGE